MKLMIKLNNQNQKSVKLNSIFEKDFRRNKKS